MKRSGLSDSLGSAAAVARSAVEPDSAFRTMASSRSFMCDHSCRINRNSHSKREFVTIPMNFRCLHAGRSWFTFRFRATTRPPAPGSPAGRAAAPPGRAPAPLRAHPRRSARSATADRRSGVSSTANCRSANSLTSTARSNASSGADSVTCGMARSREREVRQRHRPSRRRRARGEQQPGLLLAHQIEQMKQRAFVDARRRRNLPAPARRSQSTPADRRARARAPTETVRRIRAPRSRRDGSCRCLRVPRPQARAPASPASDRSSQAPPRSRDRAENPRASAVRRDRARERVAAEARTSLAHWPPV